ncbi:tlde1 domain-containing protein [Desulfogranum japonicum]|uniref:tlde1 domain-containing protein n=1 Tax=Desulfogranum japonicum TaxID=231447 RepID=UPI00041CEDB0|nr:tlde1 domain-containing protein [Desulfogranum japonicum]
MGPEGCAINIGCTPADPIGLDGGINLYAYVEDDPVNWIDSNGLLVSGVLDTKNNTLTLTDDDTKEQIVVEAFSGGHSTADGIVSPGVGREKTIPQGDYFIVDNPHPIEGHEDWFGVIKDDECVDDYDQDSGRGGFRLHLGQTSWGCITINLHQTNALKKWQQIQEMIKNTKTNEVDFRKGPHFWNRTEMISSYGSITVK